MMKITILDSYATNPGDLDWEPIAQCGELTLFDRSAAQEVPGRIQEADIVLLNKAPLSKEAIERAPNLKYVGILATGYNTVDLEAASTRNIVVTNVPGYGTAAVAQHTFALLLELTNRVAAHDTDVHAGGWCQNADYCYRVTPLLELQNLTLGVIGFGQIGRAVACIGRAFGMHVLVQRRDTSEPLPPGMNYADLSHLLAESDVVTLHCPLTDETDQMMNADTLRLMKPTAFLLNTARGPLIDESALAEALSNRQLAGAAVDVLSSEPPAPDNPLLHAPNTLITPHIAWAAKTARQRLIQMAADNIRAWQQGKPQHQVKPT